MNMKTVLSVLSLASLIAVLPVHAGHGEQHDHVHDQEQVSMDNTIGPSEIKPNQVIMEVHGIVCPFCAQGVKKKLSKFTFIDRLKLNEGIFMNVENQRITVAIIDGETADVQGMFAAVLSGGYEPIRALVADAEGNTTTVDAGKK